MMSDLLVQDEQSMDALTAGLPTKSAKIRRLAEAGHAKADIARYLGIRYQFVYNVLSAPQPTVERRAQDQVGKAADTDPASAKTVRAGPTPSSHNWGWKTVGKGGRIELPAAFLEVLGVGAGDQVQLMLDENAIRIMNRTGALRELQDHVRRYVPEDVSLVDELLADRRAESSRESKDD
jgi:bifunctional DNA-binding transcriptional regulator/antitoxin component of YhaV-PrlF toxin-antitoxin module